MSFTGALPSQVGRPAGAARLSTGTAPSPLHSALEDCTSPLSELRYAERAVSECFQRVNEETKKS